MYNDKSSSTQKYMFVNKSKPSEAIKHIWLKPVYAGCWNNETGKRNMYTMINSLRQYKH